MASIVNNDILYRQLEGRMRVPAEFPLPTPEQKSVLSTQDVQSFQYLSIQGFHRNGRHYQINSTDSV